ncbi:MAG: MFS transporter [Acidobacteriia bacterium]|nr:MFS transporter [Terriglobia bacterium]
MATSANLLTVSEVIDRQPMGRFQIQAIVLCCVVAVLDGFDTQCIGFLAPSMAGTLGIPVKAFGPVFAAGLFGYLIAALATGPVADRWGRKWPVIFATLTFAIFALLTARTTSLHDLLLLRFLTGLGLGGAMPNIVALASEYAPRRLLAVVVASLFLGMPLGALLGSLISSVVIPVWGWQSVFYVGGILPLLLAAILVRSLPESVRFLTVRRSNPQAVSRIMQRISPGWRSAPDRPLLAAESKPRHMPVQALFTEGRAAGTILLWIPYFMNLLMLYFIVSWLPSLLWQAGMPVSAGVRAIALFSIGGIAGSIAEGRLINRWGAGAVLSVEFAWCTLLIGSLALAPVTLGFTLAVTLVLGFCSQGAQAGLNVLAASFYPTPIRSTGAGWALGVGRVGSIIGPLIGGLMVSWQWGLQRIFAAGAAIALCATLVMMVRSRLQNAAAARNPETDPGVA